MKLSRAGLKEVSFPLGGIGTGSIGLAGNGRLLDWEIFNRPNKGSMNGFSHFAVRAVKKDKIIARVLNGDLTSRYMGQYVKRNFAGYGFGPDPSTMCGFPHFENCVFTGEFPVAEIKFKDSLFPAEVSLTAFNPFIPLDEKNSSLPAAFFEIKIRNTACTDMEFSAAFSVTAPFARSKNTLFERNAVVLEHDTDKQSKDYGDLTVMADGDGIQRQRCWYRGSWKDSIVVFWNEFSSKARLAAREYGDSGDHDTATVMKTLRIPAGDEAKFRFLLAWNIPNNYNYWEPLKDENGDDVIWKNYYATLFEASADTALYCMENWDMLYERTLAFKNAVFSSTIDKRVIERASANLAVLKSPTVLWLEDGSFYGWEGVNELAGSCEGTCQHVWNYAYALCFLFPQLEKSIRDLEFRYNTYDTGEMEFRLKLPPGRERGRFRACLDGQMGTVIKIYRDWKISGDDDWLKRNWEKLKKILEYAWSEENRDEWDLNKDGVLEGRQHHTLDMELFGPSPWLEGFYLAALKAASEMAEYLGDSEKHLEYNALFEKGYEWTKDNLFNGEYFIQKIDITDKNIIKHFRCENYWNEETGEIKYQIGNGSEIDQLCAQWHADICGLGDIFDAKQIKTALRSVYKYNHKKSMRNFSNPWRTFSFNDESGTVMCGYPDGVYKPAVPIPYCEETMTGFEYQLAGILISRGMTDEGLEIVKSVYERFDGEKRNPWNEFECGSNYARAMASFALLPIFAGFMFDLPKGMIGFNPKVNKDKYKSFWSVGTAWGVFESKKNMVEITVYEGSADLCEIRLPFVKDISKMMIDDKCVKFCIENGRILFDKTTAEKSVKIKCNI